MSIFSNFKVLSLCTQLKDCDIVILLHYCLQYMYLVYCGGEVTAAWDINPESKQCVGSN